MMNQFLDVDILSTIQGHQSPQDELLNSWTLTSCQPHKATLGWIQRRRQKPEKKTQRKQQGNNPPTRSWSWRLQGQSGSGSVLPYPPASAAATPAPAPHACGLLWQLLGCHPGTQVLPGDKTQKHTLIISCQVTNTETHINCQLPGDKTQKHTLLVSCQVTKHRNTHCLSAARWQNTETHTACQLPGDKTQKHTLLVSWHVTKHGNARYSSYGAVIKGCRCCVIKTRSPQLGSTCWSCCSMTKHESKWWEPSVTRIKYLKHISSPCMHPPPPPPKKKKEGEEKRRDKTKREEKKERKKREGENPTQLYCKHDKKMCTNLPYSIEVGDEL